MRRFVRRVRRCRSEHRLDRSLDCSVRQVHRVDRSLDRSKDRVHRVQIMVCRCVDRSIWLGVWVGASQALCAPERGPVRVREEWKMFEVKI